MSELKRENRYLVFKRKDMDKYLSESEIKRLIRYGKYVDQCRISDDKSPFECVIVEHDWPMYEDVWSAILKYAETGEYTRPDLKARLVEANMDLQVAYEHIQHECYNDALSSINSAMDVINTIMGEQE